MQNDDTEVMDLFGSTEYKSTSQKSSKKPRPWHRLRKHVVREFQWCGFIDPLVAGIKNSGRPLRYLGLPGTDLLDLRLIHQNICEPNKVELFFLGFNTDARPGAKDQVEADVSLDEVKRLPFIDKNSIIRHDEFQRLAEHDSLAFEIAKAHAPYDVVNLDLCDGLAKEKPGVQGVSMYNAISRVISLQEKTREPWVLFITTRVGSEYNSKSAFAELLTGYQDNINKCESFKAEVESKFGETHIDLSAANLSNPIVHFDVFTIGISKWLISLGLSAMPSWRVEVLDSLSYKVKPQNPHQDIVSIAFKFIPIVAVPADKYMLSSISGGTEVNECELATKVVNIIQGTTDCDEQLREDPELLEEIAESCSLLMEQARYDKDNFKQWAIKDAQS